MNCEQVRRLLDAYVDGEIDLVTGLEIERHLAGCADCTRRFRSRQALREALQSDALYFRAPAPLREKITGSLQVTARPPWTSRLRANPWIRIAAAFVVGVLLTLALLPVIAPSSQPANTLAQEVVASHIRSLMAGHLADVASSDQHTVKPWFDGKLDFAPTVVDLSSQGFPLIGGRLDYLDQRSVTALVYKRQQHIINLFIWPSTASADTGPQSTTIQGYHVIHWIHAGATYWAVSDLEIGELRTFAGLIQAAIAQT